MGSYCVQWDKSDLHICPFGLHGLSVPQLLQGKADATWIFSGWEGVEARRRGVELNSFRCGDYGISYGYAPVLVARADTLRRLHCPIPTPLPLPPYYCHVQLTGSSFAPPEARVSNWRHMSGSLYICTMSEMSGMDRSAARRPSSSRNSWRHLHVAGYLHQSSQDMQRSCSLS